MLELKELYKTFNPGTINAKTALNGLSLTLNDGDFVTVIGGNGAGKSTMLNATAGTFFVDSGKVIIDGSDVTNLPEHKRAAFIGRVFQDPMMGTAPSMWIEENLALAARRGQRRGLSWGVTKEEKEQYRELLGGLGLGLESRLTTKVSTLSGGQRQALTLLMATLKRPKLLLLDEHTAALDPATAAKVLELSDRIVRENELTAMMITHNMKDAIVHGNRLIMMNEGRIILDIEGEEKQHLTKRDLLDKFAEVAGMQVESDELLLSSRARLHAKTSEYSAAPAPVAYRRRRFFLPPDRISARAATTTKTTKIRPESLCSFFARKRTQISKSMIPFPCEFVM